MLAKAIYTNSAHEGVIGFVNTKNKKHQISISYSDIDGKAFTFWRDRPEFDPAFSRTFFLPFQISYKAFSLFKKKKKNEGNKLKMKYRVGVGRALYCPNKVASI